MARWSWLLLLVAVPACAPDAPPDPPNELESGTQDPTTATRVLVLNDDGTRTEVRAPVAPSRLAGRYYTGDGLAVNLNLELRADGSFDLTWRGCLGVYGTAAGTWAVDPDGVVTTTTRAEELLANKPLGRLQIAALGGHYLLVQESFRDLFDQQGPSRATCFVPEAAGAAVEAAYARRLNDAVRGAAPPAAEAGPEPRAVPDRAGRQ